MRSALFLFLNLFFACFAQSQIPAERITDWTNPGSRSSFEPERIYFINQYGADSTGNTPSDAALRNALAAAGGPCKIIFPSGEFLFNQPISLPDSVTVEGSVSENGTLATTLVFGATGNHGIRLTGSELRTGIAITGPLKQGQTSLTVSQQLFKAGDYIRLYPYDDSLLVASNWGRHTTGQILRITATNGNTIHFDKPLRRTYSETAKPTIIMITPRKAVQIRKIRLKATVKASWQTSNIYLNQVANSSISQVESSTGNFAHVEISNSTGITVTDCLFKDAFSYGSGGAGYGIALQYTSGDCFIHANVFDHLRHSVLLQAGANGNVIAYNYSINPYWTGTFLPSDAAGDLVLHGNYPYMNLFEGNVAQNIVIDNSHGINGPFNTFFRNRAENYGVVMNSSPATDNQNFIANQVTGTGLYKGNFSLAGKGHYLEGNLAKGRMVPEGSQEPAVESLFGYAFSDFYRTYSTIPPVQSAGAASEVPLIEAQYRYLNTGTNVITAIEESDTKAYEEKDKEVISPNPSADYVSIRSLTDKTFTLTDLEGNILMIDMCNKTISVKHLKPGVYLVRVQGEKTTDKLIKR